MTAMRCDDGRHTVLVENFMLGQFRIRITDATRPSLGAPPGHGEIVREMCTYQQERKDAVVAELLASTDPLALAESWARPWNCEYPGGRIRLDNRPEDRPEAQ